MPLPVAVPVAPGRGLPLAVDKERGGRKRRARSPPFSAKSWGYSAFQYIMAPAGPQKKRCAAASQGLDFDCLGPSGLGSEAQNPA